ncbi:uncharacterized protein LOC113273353 [Papaver somniferum]|uniref:uncharacterized protein LOC113273353 n=1 Tax=Papaver somniferum TaxID=3469 RepID=UPI000E6FB019|nr:uncharacterized protein LOC113273353 [Papaver somniferum]
MTTRMYGLMGKVVSEQQAAFLKARISVLINSGPVGFFEISRRLRQGDPLSPILFVIAEDALRRSFSNMVEENKIIPIVNIRGVHPTHILFADDVFFEARKQQIAVEYQVNLSQFPDKYLGVILHPGRVKTSIIWGVVEMLQWEETCAPLEERGLGIRRLKVINKALLMKMVWKIQTSDAEWARFMRAKFYTVNGEWISGYKKSFVWNGLKWVIDEVRQNTIWITGNGNQISVWKDAWVKEKPLEELYPNDEYIFQKANMKLDDLIIDREWLVPQRMLLYFQVNELPIISRQDDRRIWSGTMSGEFIVSSTVEVIILHYTKVDWAKNVWHPVLHPITTSNVWKLVMGVCATDEKMQAKGLGITTNFIAEVMAIVGAAEWALINNKDSLAKKGAGLERGVSQVFTSRPNFLSEMESSDKVYYRFC